MRLRRKTMLTVAAILAVMTMVILIISSGLVMENARTAENRDVEKDMDRVLSSIASMERGLGMTARDWAGWDDTYAFVQDRNQQYIDSNLPYDTCVSLRLNFLLFFDDSLELVHGLGYDFDADEPLEVTPRVVDGVIANLGSGVLSHPDGKAGGLVLTDGGVLVVAAHAITDSTLTSPVRGALVMARYLSPLMVQEMSEDLQIKTQVFAAGDLGASGLDKPTWDSLMENGTGLTAPLSGQTMGAYRPVMGMNGTAVAMVAIQTPRDIVAQATTSISLMISTLVLVSLAFVVVTLVVTDRFTMRRVERLSRQVSDIGVRGDISHRVVMDGSDELSELADEVNKTLDAVVTMESELRESERRYRAIVNDQTEMIFRMHDDGTVAFANEAMLKELHRHSGEVVGRHLGEVLVPALAEALMGQCREAASTGKAVARDYHYYHRLEEREKWYSWIVRGIVTEGRPREYQGVGRDLTEQKEAELALGEANKKLNLLASITRHDVMNQLTVAHGFVSIAKLQATDPRTTDHLGKAEAALRSIQGYLEFTRDYQRMGMAQPVWINLGEAVDKAAGGLRYNGVDVGVDVADFEILADPLVEKVFCNLLDNSERHGGGVSRVSVTCRPREDGLLLAFEDDGRGVPTCEKEQIFQAGYGNHTGYGLFLAREILGATGMTIRETGVPGDGARFEIMVPPGRFRRAPALT